MGPRGPPTDRTVSGVRITRARYPVLSAACVSLPTTAPFRSVPAQGAGPAGGAPVRVGIGFPLAPPVGDDITTIAPPGSSTTEPLGVGAVAAAAGRAPDVCVCLRGCQPAVSVHHGPVAHRRRRGLVPLQSTSGNAARRGRPSVRCHPGESVAWFDADRVSRQLFAPGRTEGAGCSTWNECGPVLPRRLPLVPLGIDAVDRHGHGYVDIGALLQIERRQSSAWFHVTRAWPSDQAATMTREEPSVRARATDALGRPTGSTWNRPGVRWRAGLDVPRGTSLDVRPGVT